jgi:hypothetical protein
MRLRTLLAATIAATSTLVVLTLHDAQAQMIIKNPGDHPKGWELEPHLLFRSLLLPENDPGFGLGFRATIPIVENGFISKINNSVGIGLGLDWLTYRSGGLNQFIVPVVMQWNFFLSKSWSVFAEPGVALNLYTDNCDDYYRVEKGRYVGRHCRRDVLEPHVGIGARWHFKRDVTLTMRLSNNYFGVGVSWF